MYNAGAILLYIFSLATTPSPALGRYTEAPQIQQNLGSDNGPSTTPDYPTAFASLGPIFLILWDHDSFVGCLGQFDLCL